MTTKQWRIVELIQTTSEIFHKKNLENPRLNAELLLGHALGMERVDLYLNHDRPLTPGELERFRKLVRRRLKHEPLQYILGKTEFMSLSFTVTPAVLIPRSDTETLVEWVLDSRRLRSPNRILELGTGCGNIAISLAYYLANARVVAVDVSREALCVAKQNVATHGVADRVRLVQADFTAPEFRDLFSARFDVIVSNPPYIRQEQFQRLAPEISRFEPELALKNGEKPAYFYRQIAQFAPYLLSEGGELFVEMGEGHARAVKTIFNLAGFRVLEVKKDLAGVQRVLRGTGIAGRISYKNKMSQKEARNESSNFS